MLHSRMGFELLSALRALHPIKIQSLDQIRRDRESALRAGVVQRRPHFFQIDFAEQSVYLSEDRFWPIARSPSCRA